MTTTYQQSTCCNSICIVILCDLIPKSTLLYRMPTPQSHIFLQIKVIFPKYLSDLKIFNQHFNSMLQSLIGRKQSLRIINQQQIKHEFTRGSQNLCSYKHELLCTFKVFHCKFLLFGSILMIKAQIRSKAMMNINASSDMITVSLLSCFILYISFTMPTVRVISDPEKSNENILQVQNFLRPLKSLSILNLVNL